MPEVPDAGEDHGHIRGIAGGDHFRVALRASGLNDRSYTSTNSRFGAVGHWEERVRSKH